MAAHSDFRHRSNQNPKYQSDSDSDSDSDSGGDLVSFHFRNKLRVSCVFFAFGTRPSAHGVRNAIVIRIRGHLGFVSDLAEVSV